MKEPFILNGKSALVTGAAKRLGAALSQELSRAGAHIVAHYNTSVAEAHALVESIQAQGGHAWAVQADLSDRSAAESLVKKASDVAGPIDVLVNNASLFEDIDFRAASADDIARNMNTNAVAPFLIARHFAAQCTNGAILNMLDTMVQDYDKRHVPYHLSKRTLQTLTRIMAVEFAPTIRVNAVAPGLILPPPGKDMDYLEQLAHSNPLHDYGSAQDVADAALYLLSASFVTGQTLYVDGGRHLRGSMYE